MHADRRRLWKQAEDLRGCLSHVRRKDGRRRYQDREDPFKMPEPFISDEAKLWSSKTIRFMRDKTQVFTFPDNPLIRTRHTHVMEVIACSVVASEMLGLNSNLIRAAAIGHDIGHVPFGHQGEAWMARALGRPEFCHEIMAPVIAQKIERGGKGLNLTHETLNAMMSHSGSMAKHAQTQEARLLQHTDKFAYIFHDINDIRKRTKFRLPDEVLKLADDFGSRQRERTTTAIAALVVESAEVGQVSFEHSELAQKFKHLRTLMYEVYPRVTHQDVSRIMGEALKFFERIGVGDPFMMLALMTDKDTALLASRPMPDAPLFSQMGLCEIEPYLDQIGHVDLCDPDMDW